MINWGRPSPGGIRVPIRPPTFEKQRGHTPMNFFHFFDLGLEKNLYKKLNTNRL